MELDKLFNKVMDKIFNNSKRIYELEKEVKKLKEEIIKWKK